MNGNVLKLWRRVLVLSFGLLIAGQIGHAAAGKKGDRSLWVTAYYADWQQQSGYLPPEKIDFKAMSHVIQFSIVPKSDGAVDDTGPDFITPAQSQALLTPAHEAGCKVIICVGGANTAGRFRPVIDDAVRPAFVKNLVDFAVTRGYDGIDIDMEPIDDADVPHYEAFIKELRHSMDAAKQGMLLTAATAQHPDLFARLKDQFNQVNVMTYDLAGPWEGFKTWHNSGLYDAGGEKMVGDIPYPSANATMQRFITAGVPREKLALGIAFYGSVWNGADAPKESIVGVKVDSSVDYHSILEKYVSAGLYHWDSDAHASYISVDSPAGKKFVVYDDARVCAEKVNYAREQGLGGVMIWELGSGYCAGQPEGKRDPLLQAVKKAWK